LLSANDTTGPASFDYVVEELTMPFDATSMAQIAQHARSEIRA
jgi:hypothetical protein